MRRNILLILCFMILVHSCDNDSGIAPAGSVEWIKVIPDAVIYQPGKVRADSQGNLFCAYNYVDYIIDSNSAVIKLDKNGTLVWKKEFTDLIIHDFLVTPEGHLVIPSYSDGAILLTELSTDSVTRLIGTCPLPLDANKIYGTIGMNIFPTEAGYNISGSLYYETGNQKDRVGFMMETDSNANLLWCQAYFFPLGEPTVITGCAPTTDGYILFGNIRDYPTMSKFFFLKTDAGGVVTEPVITYQTSSYEIDKDSFIGYFCNTSEIIPSGDGNFYACAYNDRFNIPTVASSPIFSADDNSARVMKITPEGEVCIEQKLHGDFQNLVIDLVRREEDNGLLVGVNPMPLIGVGYLGKQNSYIARLNSDLEIQSISNIQDHYMDYLGSICRMPDGHYAYELMIQSFGNPAYKLEIVKADDTGIF